MIGSGSGGRTLGEGRPRSLDFDTIHAVRNSLLAGTPKAQIAREHGISRATLYRYLEVPARPLEHPSRIDPRG